MDLAMPDGLRVQEKASARRWSLPAGWEVLVVFLVSLAASVVNDKLCLAFFGASTAGLVYRHRKSPASVFGIILSANCQVPFLRRIHDLFHGFSPGSVILIGAYTAFPVLGLLIVRDLPQIRKERYIPVVLAAVGVLWAYCVGVMNAGMVPASIQLLQYSSGPIVFAYLVTQSEKIDLPTLCRWLLVLGGIEAAYGLYQWVSPPAWDVLWFNGAKMQAAGGLPIPFQMRTFGTLNSGSPYSYFLFFILVATVGTPRFLFVSPLMVGALATTMGRAAWGATALGWTATWMLSRAMDKGRILLAVGGTLGVVLLMALPFSARLVDLTHRFQSINNLKGDSSFRDRSGLLDAAVAAGAFEDPVGVGLGSTGTAARQTGQGIAGIDNGFLQTVWMYGWTGSLFYLGGFFWGMVRGLWRSRTLTLLELPFAGAVVGLFAANLFESSFDDMKGVMLWASLGIINIKRMGKGSATPGTE